MRESFIIYRSFFALIKLLPEKKQVKMFTAIFEYGLDEKEPNFGSEETMIAIWSAIIPQLKANNKRYKNGKKGGAPVGNSNAEKQPSGDQENNLDPPEKTTKTIQNKTTEKQPNVNDNVNDNVKDKERDKVSAYTREEIVSLSRDISDILIIDKQNEIPLSIDLKTIFEKVNKSQYLRQWKFLSKYLASSEKILAGYYDKYEKQISEVTKASNKEEFLRHQYTDEELQSVLVDLDKYWGNDIWKL